MAEMAQILDRTATKAIWSVTAGTTPGKSDPLYLKLWVYTMDEFAEDQNVPPEEMRKFDRIVGEFQQYVAELVHSHHLRYISAVYEEIH